MDSEGVTATFAHLDSKSRSYLAKYNDPNHLDYGVKIIHKDKTIYQVFGMFDLGFSPNYLGISS